jgi:hypothetical protein
MEQISPELSEAERSRIRQEMRYALAVWKEATPPTQPRNFLERLLSYLSNGFVLLLIGSFITSLLVPRFQQDYEEKKQRSSLMGECYAQFLLYANSIWQEYFLILPLALESEISKEDYIRYLNEISIIKLKRYDAFAKLGSAATVFHNDTESSPNIEKALVGYAVQINKISEAIDDWLRNLYCTPNKCLNTAEAVIDQNFIPYSSFRELQTLIKSVENHTREVTKMIINRIQSLQ